jgi:hypothetical protein
LSRPAAAHRIEHREAIAQFLAVVDQLLLDPRVGLTGAGDDADVVHVFQDGDTAPIVRLAVVMADEGRER